MLGFYAAIIITLVPSPLLEFRYFIIPFLLLRLHMPAATRTQISLELIFNGSINLATIIIFLTKTFRWSSEPENVQRFMW